MPDATITSTESTFGTISGTFLETGATIQGTITGVVAGTLDGSVGVPGPQGPQGPQGQQGIQGVPGPAGVGVPAGGTANQILAKVDGVDYNTAWVNNAASAVWGNITGTLSSQTDLQTALNGKYSTSNPAGYITSSALTPYLLIEDAESSFYPLTGNPSNFLTSASLSGYATESWVTSQGYLTSSAMSPYLTSATAAATYQTLAGMSAYLTTSAAASGYYPLTGNPSAFLTSASLTGYATESWVTSQGYLTSAPVTSVAGKTGAVTLAAGDISGLGSLAVVNDAPSDGSQYARKNGAWDVVTPASSVAWGDITGTLSDQTDLQTSLDAKVSILGGSLVSGFLEGSQVVTSPAFGDNSHLVADTAFVQSALLGGTAVARNLEVEVRNQSGATITAGSIVYISGATGNKPLITKAQANNDQNSAQTIGFVKTSIANNSTGFVIVRGELENIDTSALTEGVQLYLSPTTAGGWTTTKPSAPQHLVYVGIVIRSHPTQGTILVAVQNGYELDELHDVAIASKTNNDLLAYESSTNLWKNKSFGTLGLATQSFVTGQGYITSAALTPYLTSATASTTYYLQTNPSGYQTAAQVTSALSPYLLSSTAASTYQTQAGMSAYLTTSLALSTFQTISGMSAYATLASPVFTGDARAVTPSLADNDTSIATTAFVKGQGYLTSAPVTSVAGRTGAVTLSNTDISGLGTMATQSASAVVITGGLMTGGHSGTFSASASTTTNAGLRINPGVAPSAPVNGDVWTTTTDMLVRLNGVTETIAEQSWVTSQGYLTSSALTPYLTSATAASTYFTIANAANKADLASPVFTGDPRAPTPLTADNDTSIATTAFVKAQGYLTSAPVTSVAGKTGAVTLVVGDVSGAAPLASPTFAGTPSLPTGTTGVTQAAGTNNTTLATTAFVTAAVPVAATVAEAKAGANTAKFITANVLQKVVNSPSYYKFPRGIMSTSTSGTGAAVTAGALITQLVGSTSGVGGALHRYYGPAGVDIVNATGWAVGAQSINFGKKFRITGSTIIFSSTNTIVRVSFGKNANQGVGDPNQRSIGWRRSQATGFIEIVANNGTSLVTLTTASNPGTVWFEWELYNDGAGNVEMFVNDVSIGTLSGGPTTLDYGSAPTYVEEIECTAAPTGIVQTRFRNGGLFLQP